MQELPRVEGVPEESYAALAARYGHAAHEVLALAAERGELAQPVVPGLPDLLAEAVLAARSEQARSVGDVLLRRTRLGLLAAGELSGDPVRRVAEVLARELQWDPARMAAEIERFAEEARAEGLTGGASVAHARTATADELRRRGQLSAGVPRRPPLSAARRRARPGAGARPLLMGIVNASPDSFSDGGRYARRRAALVLARRAVRRGRRHPRCRRGVGLHRTPRRRRGGGDRARGAADRAHRRQQLGVLVSVDTYKPAVARAAIAAGASIVNDVSGLRDPELARVCAQTGAALVVMHTRAAPKQRLQDPELLRRGRRGGRAGVPARAHRAGAPRGGGARAADRSTPAPTSPRRPRRRLSCCRTLERLHELELPLLMAISRKDFIGALTRRSPRERLAGTLAALAHGVDAGAHIFRVHDIAAAADFLRVRAALRGRGTSAQGSGARRGTSLRAPAASDPLRAGPLDILISASGCRRLSNATGRQPPNPDTKEKQMAVMERSELEASPLADLHAIADQVGLDGFRRLRKADLIDAILERTGGTRAPVRLPSRVPRARTRERA